MPEALDITRVLMATFVATGVIAHLFVPRARATGTVLLLAGTAGMLATVAPASVRSPLVLAPAVVLGSVLLLAAARALGGGTWLDTPAASPADEGRGLGRRRWLLVAAALVVPLRVPMSLGGEQFNLLLPLYLVLALAGARMLLDDVSLARRGLVVPPPPAARALDLGIAALVTVACLSLSWSVDLDASAVKIALVYGPFALLYLVLRDWLPSARMWPLALAFGGVMLLAALVGLWQEGTETIWQNAKVEVANTYAPNFRTNSFFWDPNIYGRYLVAALLAIAVGLLTARRPRRSSVALAVVALAVMGSGLWYSYSQSSFVALAAGCIVLAAVLLPTRLRIALAVAVLASSVALPLAAAQLEGRDTRTRADVASRGLVLAAERPITGLGVGAFEHASRRLSDDRGLRGRHQNASHTTPVTILAELGIFGAAAYLLVLTAAGALTVAGATRAREVALGRMEGPSPAVGWWAGSTLAAIAAHSMFYAGFFEDPLVWICAAALVASAQREGPNAATVSARG